MWLVTDMSMVRILLWLMMLPGIHVMLLMMKFLHEHVLVSVVSCWDLACTVTRTRGRHHGMSGTRLKLIDTIVLIMIDNRIVFLNKLSIHVLWLVCWSVTDT